jgi:hypothetical protein
MPVFSLLVFTFHMESTIDAPLHPPTWEYPAQKNQQNTPPPTTKHHPKEKAAGNVSIACIAIDGTVSKEYTNVLICDNDNISCKTRFITFMALTICAMCTTNNPYQQCSHRHNNTTAVINMETSTQMK